MIYKVCGGIELFRIFFYYPFNVHGIASDGPLFYFWYYKFVSSLFFVLVNPTRSLLIFWSFQRANFSVQLLRCVRLFATPWTAACQASLSITNSWSLLRLMSIKSVMPSNHLILCRPVLLSPAFSFIDFSLLFSYFQFH